MVDIGYVSDDDSARLCNAGSADEGAADSLNDSVFEEPSILGVFEIGSVDGCGSETETDAIRLCVVPEPPGVGEEQKEGSSFHVDCLYFFIVVCLCGLVVAILTLM
ncbi:b42.1 [miniopterid betaherpesvirus 1]|uniref:B42.1 n=1 Tax=miniopterid betaherpesvirus 1 TaxID=3070189 RepID=I3VQ24_9BETA|nr:b42.1 [miniopterid betaherpesvirus 1]AFK83868.1 b42.1 [miniopterid betaherpesvirus 1]